MARLRSLCKQARSCLGRCFTTRLDSDCEGKGTKYGAGKNTFQVREETSRTPSSSARIQANVPSARYSSTRDDEDFSACWQMQPIAKLYVPLSDTQGSASVFKQKHVCHSRNSDCGILEPFMCSEKTSSQSICVGKSREVGLGMTGFKSWEQESLQLSQGRAGSSLSVATEENICVTQPAEHNSTSADSYVDDFRQTVFYKDLTNSIELIGESLPGPMGFPAYCQAVLHINRAIHEEGRRFTYDISKRNIMKSRPEAAHIYANMELEDWDALNTSLPPSSMPSGVQRDRQE